MEYVIKIKGLIGYDKKEDCFTYPDLLAHLEKAKAYDSIMLDIDSQGGYINVMEKMVEALRNSGKTLRSMNSGLVASCATILFLLPEKHNRLYNPKKGEFVIHYPIAYIEGTSEDLRLEADELEVLENKFATFYSEITGTSFETIKGIMKEDLPLSAETVASLGFADMVVEERKMVFIGKEQSININSKKMNEVNEKLNTIEKMISKLFPSKKMVLVVDQSGAELEFPELQSEADIVVGSMATIGGSPANGEYILKDEKTIIVVDGIVTEIKEMEAEPTEEEQLKAQIADLNTQLEEMSASKMEAETALEENKTQLMAIKAEFAEVKKLSSKFMVAPAAPKDQKTEPKTFTFKKK